MIRAYSGVYYARTPLLTIAGAINNFRTPPGDVTLQLPAGTNVYDQFLTIGIDLNNFALDDLPILTPAQLFQIAQNVAGSSFNPLTGLQLTTVGQGLKNPRSFQFGFAFERELRDGLTFGLQYDQVNTKNLNRNRDVDLPAPFIRPGDMSLRPFFGINAQTPPAFRQNRPITALGNAGFLQVRESSARSLYQAFTVRAQLRRRFGQFDAFYTLARDLDDDSSERNASFAEYDNSFNLEPEYNYSRLDRRHQFVFNTVINAPYGFEVSALGRFRSGLPIDPTVSSIIAPAGSNLTNAQYAALVTLSGSTVGELNQDRGNTSNAGGGNTGGDRPYAAPGVSFRRNSFRNRPVYNVDLRVQKEVLIGEKYRIVPSLEFFNVLGFDNIEYLGTNVTNYGNPGVNERTGEVLAPSNPLFLKLRNADGSYITSNRVSDPFRVQVGIRFLF